MSLREHRDSREAFSAEEEAAHCPRGWDKVEGDELVINCPECSQPIDGCTCGEELGEEWEEYLDDYVEWCGMCGRDIVRGFACPCDGGDDWNQGQYDEY